MKKKNSGFTLVELLAVIVLLAIVITIASSSVIGILNKSKKNMSEEVRNNLKEAALAYALETIRLEPCGVTFSKEIFEEQNINNLNSNTNCFKRITVDEVKKSGLFEDERGFCNQDDVIIVYRYSDGVNTEYKAYTSNDICKN